MNNVVLRLHYLLIVLTAGVLSLALSGCEEHVTAVTGTDRAFSFYGVLRPEADTQFVSVYPITDRLTLTEPEPLDAEVTATDQTTGETYQMRDSIVQEESGDYAHIFWIPVRAEYGHTYEIEATNNTDPPSRVEITVPPSAELDVRPPEERIGAGVINPVYVDGEVPRLMKVEVEYHVKFDEGPQENTTARMTIPYEERISKVEGGWMIEINLSRDFQQLSDRLRSGGLWSYRYGLVMLEMTLRLAAVNEEWDPPGGTFDAEVLVQPGTMSNVENGFGFVGAGFRLNETWRPDAEYLSRAGWSEL